MCTLLWVNWLAFDLMRAPALLRVCVCVCVAVCVWCGAINFHQLVQLKVLSAGKQWPRSRLRVLRL